MANKDQINYEKRIAEFTEALKTGTVSANQAFDSYVQFCKALNDKTDKNKGA
jgi:hypothetical protein